MAAQKPRPGVEIVQEFTSTSPSIVLPQLVPCNIAPFFEIIEVTNSDGTANTDAQLADLYRQLELTVPQLSFPSPRGNIDEVDVLEASIRFFFNFGGQLIELSRTQSFLLNLNLASQPSAEGTATGPFALSGKQIVLQFDSHDAVASGANTPNAANLPATANVPIAFSADGLTIAEVVSEINAVIPGVASDSTANPGQLLLTSTKFGAAASVVVRSTGSANTDIGFSAVEDELAVGAGFITTDDGDGDTTSPRIEFFTGAAQRLVSAVNVPILAAPNFNDSFILQGDTVVADGVVIGDVDQVFSDRLVMEVEQNNFDQDTQFAPRYFWVQANNLTFPASASTAALQTATVAVAVATQPFIVGSAIFAAVGPGESMNIDISIAGVAQATEVIGSGAGFATLALAVAGINTAGVNVEAFEASNLGDEVDTGVATHLGLRTIASITGSGAAITLTSQSTGMALAGFSSLPVSDIGENQRYLPGTQPIAVAGSPFAPPVGLETITYTYTHNGVAQAAETITWAAAHATIALAIADWNSQALYTEAYEADAAGVETTAGTFFAIRPRSVEGNGADTDIDITATDSIPSLPVSNPIGVDGDLNGEEFKWQLDGNPLEHAVIFVADEDDGGTSLQAVIDKINDETPGIASASAAAPPSLVMTSSIVGEASQMTITDGSANDIGTVGLGFTDDTTTNGNGRPNPDLALDIFGDAIVQAQQLRDPLTGSPFPTSVAQIFVAYKALRLDVSPDADNPALLRFPDVATLLTVAGPITTDNPGAAMSFLTLINSPGTSVTAIGVPETSADAPDGTPIGYAKCFNFLESQEVYALSLATQLGVIHQAAITHVVFMSAAENKGERIVFFNPPVPDRALPTLIASGSDANTTPTPGKLTVDVNLAPGIIAEGLDPALLNPLTGAIVNEIYLDLAGDDNFYLIQRVENGTDVFLRTTFVAGEGNDDQFFSATAPTGVISDDFTVAIRGAQLLVPGTTDPDKDAIALNIQLGAAAFGERRAYYIFPDVAGINITGLEQIVPGYYATSAIIGMVANLPPQQGFTNFPMTGLTQVPGSSDTFSNSQLSVMAAGGVYILIQEAIGAPVTSRHQLSTDLSSIETQELSITKVVDFVAKFIRAGLKSFIGRSNITQAFIDQLASVLEGLLEFLKQTGVLIGSSVNNVLQDADNPDTVLVDITLDVPFPANFIRVTLVV